MATLTVRKNGTGQYTQINDAILAAAHGDTIDIGAGTYLENVDLYKGVVLQGAGKDLTIIQGKLTGDSFTGTRTSGSKFITGISSSDLEKLIAGRVISGTGITAGTRIDNIDLENSRIELTAVAAASGTTALTQVAIPQGSIHAKQQTETISVTYSADPSDAAKSLFTLAKSPVCALAVGDRLVVGASFREVIEVTSATTGKLDGTPLANGNSTLASKAGYWSIKDLCAMGYDGATPSDAGAIFISSPSSGQQRNWLIQGCKVVADGDHGLVTSNNLSSDGGTVQDCVFEGKTFVGDEPAEVPAFSSFSATGTIQAIGDLDFTVQYPSVLGMVQGSPFASEAFRVITSSGLKPSGAVVSLSGDAVTSLLPNETLSALSVAGTKTIGSAFITGISASNLNLLLVGLAVTGSGIPAGTKILSIDSVGSRIQLSANATTAGAVTMSIQSNFSDNGDGSYSYVLAREPRSLVQVGDKIAVGVTTRAISEVTTNRTGKIEGSLASGAAKVVYAPSGAVGESFTSTFTNVQFSVPNVARQMVVIGNSGSVSNCLNTTFKGNLIKGRTGAVIAASGVKTMFNSALTVDTVGGLVEDNIIDGFFGAGQPNPLASNNAIRARGTGTIVRNNINKIFGGRGNSGFLIAGTDENNITVDQGLISPVQEAGQNPSASMSEGFLLSFSVVSSDPVFGDSDNWKLVAFVYKHTGSSKRLVAAFKQFEKTVSMRKKAGMLAGQEFQLIKIILVDESARLVVRRNQIEGVESYDLSLQ